MLLMMTSLFSGRHSYNVARDEIAADLNQALTLTLNDRKNSIVAQDTIKAYKQLRTSSADGRVFIAVSDERFCRYLNDRRLKDYSFITFDIVDDKFKNVETDNSVISSDTLIITEGYGGETLAVRGYARLSSAAIFGMSDQRTSSVLAISAFLWALFSFMYIRRHNSSSAEADAFGGMCYSETDNCFYGSDGSPIRFTPMQQQLMMMFWNSPNHSLTKEEICAGLWPKKEDANDTLYTLIKRIKPVVETHTELRIISDRGRSYSMKIRNLCS